MIWEDIIIEEARRRRKIFENLDKYLVEIRDLIKAYDRDAEIYLFGSVLESRYLLSSDIDILIVTSMDPGKVLAILWNNGFEDPFEFHIVSRTQARHFIKKVGKVRRC